MRHGDDDWRHVGRALTNRGRPLGQKPDREDEPSSDGASVADVGRRTLEGFARASRLNAWLYGKLRAAIQGDVLEIGSGVGNLSRLIVRDARRAVLTDVDPRYVKVLRRDLGSGTGVEVLVWNLDEPPPAALTAGGRQFDAIVAVNVIEHLRDDQRATQALASLLRPGGSLVIYVPACPWAFGTLDVALGHHRRYTRASLLALAMGAGLVPTRPRYMNRLGLLGWLVSGRLLRQSALSARMIALFDRMVGMARVIDVVLTPLPLGLGLVTRARKPEGSIGDAKPRSPDRVVSGQG